MTEEKTSETDELCVIRDMLKLLEPLTAREAVRAAEYVLRRAKDKASEDVRGILARGLSGVSGAGALGASRSPTNASDADWMNT